MTIEQLPNVYTPSHLKTFLIHLTDGRSVLVHRRELIMSASSGRTIVVAQPEDDTFNIIDLLLVADLELKPAAHESSKKHKR